ncbi:hypothetical protein [Aliarcobacter butzleri]|uniref:Phage protein n=1 Tax=Aliarcobacter butzleri TaxID=28197 RepID=A0AAW7QAE2_9BACT|nr:hypothetical protein [Aliarcobacter butzleri]MCT7616648.1 hypothetical protein [Aliarcobacter butzleri]MDN5063723.1 hypothetical protein [Aliarcobacter butzleri]MDN5064957.1 hypothetical protein [Aliarcobacter butzleri]MDN5106510.1 hypothetical protein [Aliarcobacter butzleri]MDN5123232.1 hypothetical protein [Aliarcobacter butzleri]
MNNEKWFDDTLLIELGRKEDLAKKELEQKNKCKKFCDFLFKLKNKLVFWSSKK